MWALEEGLGQLWEKKNSQIPWTQLVMHLHCDANYSSHNPPEKVMTNAKASFHPLDNLEND